MIKKTIFLLFAVALVWGCAKQGYPSGGPKDVEPPIAGVANPPSGTTSFAASEFYIPFDEYVTVKDAENNVLVSPPMAKKPEYVSKGKGLLVRIKDTLQENTTYLFQFKGAVADINEGNVLESYEYCFSTGAVVDSMSISGSVVDALTLKPREEVVSVMLYQSTAGDSAVAMERPVYITRCDKGGNFRFNHIREGEYRIAAIEDENKDMKLTPGEGVAFCDSLVRSIYVKKASKNKADGDSMEDAAAKFQKQDAPMLDEGEKVRLLISTKKTDKQRVAKSEFLSKGHMLITMQCAIKEYSIAPLGGSEEELLVGINSGRDTLNIWSRNENCDSIVLVLKADELQDTLKLKYRTRGKRQNAAAPQGNVAFVKSKIQAKTDYFDSLRLEFANPLKHGGISDSVVRVKNLKDSTMSFARIIADEKGIRGVVDYPLQPGARYELKIAAGSLVDMYGHKCDSVKISTEISTPDQYGRLIIALETDKMPLAEGGQYVIQLLNEKLEVVEERIATHGGRLTFDHLKGGKYQLRAIADENGNGKWDAGDYWQHLQPERVAYFEKTMDLRENWDIEETFAPNCEQ